VNRLTELELHRFFRRLGGERIIVPLFLTPASVRRQAAKVTSRHTPATACSTGLKCCYRATAIDGMQKPRNQWAD